MAQASLADWVAALGTVGALLLGFAILFREQLDRRIGHARRVNAWAVEVLPKRDMTESGAIVGMDGKCVVVAVQNSGVEPAYDVHVWVHHSYSPNAPRSGSHERSVLPPGLHEFFVDGVCLSEGGLAGLPYVDVTFRDAGGRRWQRLYSGELSSDKTSPYGRTRRRRPSRREVA